MPKGRILSCALAVATVGVGAVVVVGLAGGGIDRPAADAGSAALATHAALPATKSFARPGTPAPTNAPPTAASVAASGPAVPAAPVTATSRATTAVVAPAPAPRTAVVAARATAVVAPKAPAAVRLAPKPAAVVRGQALPLRYSTGTATKVVTVTAHSRGSTTATVQAWRKAPGGGWLKVGSGIHAYIGSQGMTTSPSESKSATPMGSFTLTQAFGAYSDPGTALTYHRTDARYYWMSTTSGSQARLYNTMQVCPASRSGCYANGVNERLYYETPAYNYAVVIDYNTNNAPGGVRLGRGSAFFFHVSTGSPTAGCVAIAQSRLVPILRWLTPSTHPRMLIGTA